MPHEMLREIQLGLQRFWSLKWFVKWPIIVFVALMPIAAIGSLFDEEPVKTDGSSESLELQADTSATLAQTPIPSQPALTVSYPVDGASLNCEEVTIQGVAPPRAEIHLNIGLGKDPKFNAGDNGQWEYKTKLDEGKNEFDFFLQEAKDTRAKFTVTYSKEGINPFIEITNPAPDILLTDPSVTVTGSATPCWEVVRKVPDAKDQGARVSNDGTWSMAFDLEDGEHTLDFFLAEDKNTKKELALKVDTKLAPSVVTITRDGVQVTLGNDRQAEVVLFYFNMMRYLHTAQLNEDALISARDGFGAGEISAYDVYKVAKALESAQHSLADQVFSADAPSDLGDAKDVLWQALANHGDAAGHIAEYVNTLDYQELNQAETDLAEAEDYLGAGLADIFGESQESGLDPVDLTYYVECDPVEPSCRLVNPAH